MSPPQTRLRAQAPEAERGPGIHARPPHAAHGVQGRRNEKSRRSPSRD